MKRISILAILFLVTSGILKAQYVLEPELMPSQINQEGHILTYPNISPDGKTLFFKRFYDKTSSIISAKHLDGVWSVMGEVDELSNIKAEITPDLLGFNGESLFFNIFKYRDEILDRSKSKNKPIEWRPSSDEFELKTFRIDLHQGEFSLSIPHSFSQGIEPSQLSFPSHFGNPHKIFFQSSDRETYESYKQGDKWTSPKKLPSILGAQKLIDPVVVGENAILYSLYKNKIYGSSDGKIYMSIRTQDKWSYPVLLEIAGLKNARISSYCEATFELFLQANGKIYTARLPSKLQKLISTEYPITTENRVENSISTNENLNAAEGIKPQYFALLIGIEDYQYNQANLVDLSNPIGDATSLKSELLENYTFEEQNITVLENPDREEIINSFEKLASQLTEKDNLLIFYAGHGVWDEKLNIGYWLSADATESKSNWIPNSTVRDYIAGLNTKHTLLISDACFSGSIFKTREVTKSIDDYGYYRLNKLPSRKAMTSGTLNTVPDDSQFMKYLLKALGANEKEYFPSKQLFHEIEIAIINNTANVPQFGTIQNTGDEGGDFIFIKKEKE